MKYLFVLLLVCCAISVPAQQMPWSGLPLKKQAINTDGNELPVFLVVDTLHRQSATGEAKDISYLFYLAGEDLIGYGYRDAEGRPCGVWRYYRLKNKDYQLYCEGYYTKLASTHLAVTPGIAERFPVSTATESKQSFIQSLPDKLFFSGEWRFYQNGRLEKIVVLDKKVNMPYEVSVQFTDNASGSADQLVILQPANRLTGNVLAFANFSNYGFMQSISTDEFKCQFDAQGRIIIAPLQDQAILEE